MDSDNGGARPTALSLMSTCAIHNWDNGSGDSGLRMMAYDGKTWTDIELSDPDAMAYLDRMFDKPKTRTNPQYIRFREAIETAQAETVLLHLPADLQAAIEAAQ